MFWLSCFRVALRAKQESRPRAGLAPGCAGQCRRGALQPRDRRHGPHVLYCAHLTNVRFPVTLALPREIVAFTDTQPDFLARLSLPAERAGARGHGRPAAYRAAPHPGGCGAAAARDPGRRGAGLGRGASLTSGAPRRAAAPPCCCDQGGTHISEDLLIVEPVDRPGLAPPGERSAKVYLTNLYNPVLPLIRYEITDEVTFLPGPCPCGSAHQRIADVQAARRRVHLPGPPGTPAPVPHRVSRRLPAGHTRWRQTPSWAAIAVRCTAPVSLDGLRDRVAAALARAGLERPQATVEVVDRFERPGGPAKLKRFIPLAAGTGQ